MSKTRKTATVVVTRLDPPREYIDGGREVYLVHGLTAEGDCSWTGRGFEWHHQASLYAGAILVGMSLAGERDVRFDDRTIPVS